MHSRRLSLLLGAALVCPILHAASPACADDGVPSVEEIVKTLSPPERTRSFRTRGYSGFTPEEQPKMEVGDSASSALFAKGSADLTARGRETLNNYVKAFNQRSLAPHTFLIVGHASRDGAESFNVDLSRRRADAAREFIISGGDTGQRVAPDRVRIAWRGSDQPKIVSDPYNPENRRFEIRYCGKTPEELKVCEDIVGQSFSLDRRH